MLRTITGLPRHTRIDALERAAPMPPMEELLAETLGQHDLRRTLTPQEAALSAWDLRILPTLASASPPPPPWLPSSATGPEKLSISVVRNKVCATCARAPPGEAPKEHSCHKNWQGSSTSMAQSVLVQGFRKSLEIHSVKYMRLIADDVGNNGAAHYNSVVAKFVGGKRINYSLKGSYETRCFAASLSFNSKNAYHDAADNFVHSLALSEEDTNQLQKATGQSGSVVWKDERHKRLTASLFRPACKMKPSTGFEATYDVVVKECGLFVDQKRPFLGATPDGLVGDDTLVEMKCPYAARDLTPLEGAVQDEFTAFPARTSNYWYQMQGQLNICDREKCLFPVWTREAIHVETISMDRVFWENKMLPRLQKFYMHCLLPELVNLRSRGLPIREPAYIIEAHRRSAAKAA
ncbi:uncharacterized protein LOC144148274 [Haemaphysalis longicornis]